MTISCRDTPSRTFTHVCVRTGSVETSDILCVLATMFSALFQSIFGWADAGGVARSVIAP